MEKDCPPSDIKATAKTRRSLIHLEATLKGYEEGKGKLQGNRAFFFFFLELLGKYHHDVLGSGQLWLVHGLRGS